MTEHVRLYGRGGLCARCGAFERELIGTLCDLCASEAQVRERYHSGAITAAERDRQLAVIAGWKRARGPQGV